MNNKTIIIAECDGNIAQKIQELLSKQGYTIGGILSRTQDLITITHEVHPDLILMNAGLDGDIDGIQACNDIRRKFDIPVVYLINDYDTEHLGKVKQTDCFGFIMKPINETILEMTVWNAFQRHRRENELREDMKIYRTGQEEIMHRLEHSLKEKEILIKEVHHRVKNNLQVISSLLTLQSINITDKKMLDIFKTCNTQIQTISLVHQMLYQSNNLTYVNINEFIKSLLSYLTAFYSINSGKITINTTIDDIMLEIRKAMPFSIIINEIISNSFKYAFPDDNQSGTIDIQFSNQNGSYTLLIKDNGIGLPDNETIEQKKSLGLTLIYSLCEQLSATVSLDGEKGTAYTITFP